MIPKEKQDPWDWKPAGSPCTGRHAWVRYISYDMRECCDCGAQEALWADWGMGSKPDKAAA